MKLPLFLHQATCLFHIIGKLRSACAALTLLAILPVQAETLILSDLANNSATGAAANPGLFAVGGYSGYEFGVGNFGNAPQKFRTMLKFDISGLQNLTVSDVTLNLSSYFSVFLPNQTSQEIGVSTFGADKGSAAFVAADLFAVATSVGSFTVSNPSGEGTLFSLNVTSALQNAIDLGYDYFSVRVNDITTEAISSSPYGTALVSFSNTSTSPSFLPYLEYTAVPEPSAAVLAAGALLAGFALRRKMRVNC